MQFVFLRLMFLLILAETNLPMLSAKSMIRDNGPVKRNDAPCKLKVTGPWADFINITVTPNPPRLGEYIHLTVDAIVKESVWLLTMRWNGTLDGGDIHGSDQRILCDINKHTDMCPAKKGDTRHYEKELNPGFLPQGSYSGQLQILDEKDEVAITVRVDHCTFK